MNRDTLTGLVLMVIAFLVFSWWTQPSAEDIENQRKQDSIAAVARDAAEKQHLKQAEKAAAEAEAAAKGDTTALFHAALNGKATPVVLKNEKVELTLSTKGGTIEKAVVKGFLNADNSQNDVTLFDGETQNMNFMLAGKQDNIITRDLYFTHHDSTGRQRRLHCHGLSSWQGLYAALLVAGKGTWRHVRTQLQ